MEVETAVKSSEKLCNGTNGSAGNDKVQFILNLKNGKVNGVHKDSDTGDRAEEEEMDVEDNHKKENKELKMENGDDSVNDSRESMSPSNMDSSNGDNDKTEDLENKDIDSAMEVDKTEADNIDEKPVENDKNEDISDKESVHSVDSEKEESNSNDSSLSKQTQENKAEEESEVVEEKSENKVLDKNDSSDPKTESSPEDSTSKEKEADIGEGKEDSVSTGDKDKSDDKATEKPSEKNKDDQHPVDSKETEKDDHESKDQQDSEDNKDTEKDTDKKKDNAKDSENSPEKAVDLTDGKPAEKKNSSKPSRISAALKPSPVSAQLRPMAGLLFDLGMDLARQQVYKDLIRIQMKKQSMDKLDDKETRQLDKLKEAYDDLVSKNEPFLVDTNIKCDQCQFKGDLDSVLENHKEYGHTKESGLIKCSYCDEHFKASHPFLVHMDQKHKKKGRVLARHSFFVCPFCPFEHNSKASFNKHILRCERVFNLARNLEPTPADCDIPIKLPKPPATAAVTVAKARPPVNAAAAAQAAVQAAAKKASLNTSKAHPANAQSPSGRPQNRSPSQQASQPRPPVVVAPPGIPGAQMVQVGNQWYTMVNVNGQRFLTPLQTPVAASTPPTSKAANIQHPTPKSSPKPSAKPSLKPPSSKSIMSSQSSKNRQSQAALAKSKDKGGNFEICEICGGFVKDRESLRIHFYWAHKVDIHKDVFNKGQPNLACDKCNFRTWTVQGLTRHKSMAHKEVLKGKDKARMPFYCMLCRPSPELLHTETFWLHMAAKHSVGPDTIFNYPHCVVCGVPNIGVPRALETHMLNIHSQLFSVDLLELARKLVASKPSAPTDTRSSKQHSAPTYTCDPCGLMLNSQREYEQHCKNKHLFQCSRCTSTFPSRDVLLKHFHDQHKDEKDHCPICDEIIPIGRPLVRHMRSKHMKQCSVQITRMPKKELDQRIAKYIECYGSPMKTPNKSRKRSFHQPANVIVLEDTPTKKSRTSATRMGVSEARRKKKNLMKEVINVDGEDILVEMQQDDDEDEDESTDNANTTIDSTPEKEQGSKGDKSDKKLGKKQDGQETKGGDRDIQTDKSKEPQAEKE